MTMELRTTLRTLLTAWALTASGCAVFSTPPADDAPRTALSPALQARLDRLMHEIRYSKGQTLLAQLREISAFGKHAVAPVIAGPFADADARLRAGAVYVLGEVDRLEGDARAREAVIKALRDSDGAVRLEAARALLEAGDMSGADLLVTALDDTQRGIRVRAFLTLSSATGESFGYNPDATPELRRAAAERYRTHFQSQPAIRSTGSAMGGSNATPDAG